MTELQCRSGGGLVLVDHGILAKWKAMQPHDEPDFAELLAIAVDPTGRTDQFNRWAGEKWSDVWKRETTPLVELANAGELAAVIFQCGDYHCDLSILDENLGSIDTPRIDQWLYVPTGIVVIAELGKLAENWEVAFPVEHNSFAQTEVSVAKGWSKVSFIFPRQIEVQGQGRRRVYGSPETPACLVRCAGSSERRICLEELPIFPSLHE